MRHWLRPPTVQLIVSSYSLPFSMLSPGGINRNSLALSSILSAFYLSLFLYILEKHLKILDLKISILSFVDDGLLLTQSKSFLIYNVQFYNSYNIVFNLFSNFGLLVKHSKTEVFHFSRSHRVFNLPPPLIYLL